MIDLLPIGVKLKVYYFLGNCTLSNKFFTLLSE
nr:MAG TPA: hypothetical protein [Bacteriophage sp.]